MGKFYELPGFPLDKWHEIMGGAEDGRLTGQQRRFLKRFLDSLNSAESFSDARFEQCELPRPRLGADEQGLVVSVPVAKTRRGHRFGKHLDPQHLRFALTFWDKVDFPVVEVKPIRLSAEERELQRCGVLVRTKFINNINWKVIDVYFDAAWSAFVYHERREPGGWAVGQDASSEQRGKSEARSLLLSLQSCTLVPDASVPLYEILEFRHRRRPELLRLRTELQMLAEAIVASPDRPLRERTEVARLNLAVADHLKSSREWKFPLRLTDVQAKIDAKAIAAGAAVAVSASTAGIGSAGAMLAGIGATAMAALSMTSGMKVESGSKSPYAYVSRFHNELIRN